MRRCRFASWMLLFLLASLSCLTHAQIKITPVSPEVYQAYVEKVKRGNSNGVANMASKEVLASKELPVAGYDWAGHITCWGPGTDVIVINGLISDIRDQVLSAVNSPAADCHNFDGINNKYTFGYQDNEVLWFNCYSVIACGGASEPNFNIVIAINTSNLWSRSPSPRPQTCYRQDGDSTSHPIQPATAEKTITETDFRDGAGTLNLIRSYRSSRAVSGDLYWVINNVCQDRGARISLLTDVAPEGVCMQSAAITATCGYGPGNYIIQYYNKDSMVCVNYPPNWRPGRYTLNINKYTPVPTSRINQVWTHNYNAHLSMESNQIIISIGDEAPMVFQQTGDPTIWNSLSGYGFVRHEGTNWLFKSGNDNSVFIFDSTGRLATKQSSNGSRVDFNYDSSNRLTQVFDQFNRSLTFNYGGNGVLSSVVTPDGRSIFYAVDGAGNLSSVTYPDSTVRNYVYENSNWPLALTGIVDEAGNRTQYAYDSLGRATSSSLPGGVESVSISYPTASSANGPVHIVDAAGTGRDFSYSIFGEKLAVTSASMPMTFSSGSKASRSQSTNGTILSDVDFLGYVTNYQWDTSRYLLLSETIAANTAVARTLSKQWHPSAKAVVKAAEPQSLVTYVYNGQPDPFSNGAIASCVAGSGQLLSGEPVLAICKKVEQATTDNNGSAGFSASIDTSVAAKISQWTYTQYGQIASAIDARGYTTNYTYDPNGNIKAQTNPLGHTTHYTQYDGAGRLLQSIDANGVVSNYTYDSRGRLLAMDVGGQSSSYTYTATGLISSITQSSGTVTNYTYDVAGRLVAVTDGLGNKIQYSLDLMSKEIGKTINYPGGVLSQQVVNSYNNAGLKQQVTGRD